MFSLKLAASVLVFAALASAAPTALEAKSELVSPIVTICTDTLNPRSGCVDIPVVAGTCVNFIGGLTFFNKEVSFGKVPPGFVCTFFKNFGCLEEGGDDAVFLLGGTHNFISVQSNSGLINFNDMASSFSCLPI